MKRQNERVGAKNQSRARKAAILNKSFIDLGAGSRNNVIKFFKAIITSRKRQKERQGERFIQRQKKRNRDRQKQKE